MRRNIPSTQALACFEVAARHESYTCAAQELSLTQSAVSRQIQALEEFWRATVLLHAPRRGAHACGRALRAPGGALAAGSRARHARRHGAPGEGGALSLAAGAHRLLRAGSCPRLPQLARQHPDIVVHIETQTRPFSVCRHHVRCSAVMRAPPSRWRTGPVSGAAAHARRRGAGAARSCLNPRRTGVSRSYQGVAAEALAGCCCCSKASRPYGWRCGLRPWAWMRPMPSMVRVTSCSLCWPWPPRTAWGGADPALLIEAELAMASWRWPAHALCAASGPSLSHQPRAGAVARAGRLQRLAGDHGRSWRIGPLPTSGPLALK